MKDDHLPHDYADAWNEFEAIRDRSICLDQTEEERRQSSIELNAALEQLEANSHWRWLQEVQQDERAAQEIALSQAAMSASFAPEHLIWDEDQHDRYALLCRTWNLSTDDERRRFLDNLGVTWDQ